MRGNRRPLVGPNLGLRESPAMDFGRVGVWSGERRRHPDLGGVAEAAAELEELGYSALFIPCGAGGDILERSEHLLRATRNVPVAPGILNVWMHDGGEVAAATARLDEEYAGLFELGLGIGHAPS